MLAWLSEYLGTVIAALVLLAVIIAVAVSLVRDKKAGRSTCGANCAHCAMAGSCHNAAKNAEGPKVSPQGDGRSS
jgi:hypothetical protein